MTKIEMVKAACTFVVSLGVGTIVNNAIKSTTPATVGTLKKVCIGIGGLVLSGMICDKATQYTEQQIDGAIKQIKGAVRDGTLD